MTLTVDEKRKRPTILLIAATILVGLTLGYIYSYHTANLQLLEKHTALNFRMQSCKARTEKSIMNLKACVDTNREERFQRKEFESALSNEKNNKIALQDQLDSTKSKLTNAFNFYVAVSGILGASVDGDAVVPNNTSILTEAINKLKNAHQEYMTLQNDYVTVAKDKEACEEKSKKLEGEKGELVSKNKALADQVATLEAQLKLKPKKNRKKKVKRTAKHGTEAKDKEQDTSKQDESAERAVAKDEQHIVATATEEDKSAAKQDKVVAKGEDAAKDDVVAPTGDSTKNEVVPAKEGIATKDEVIAKDNGKVDAKQEVADKETNVAAKQGEGTLDQLDQLDQQGETNKEAKTNEPTTASEKVGTLVKKGEQVNVETT